ncbi:hypothetical protein [Methylorubrum extorquens]|uniref:hypothetical protein n=1 Tax=Methylorubrum extorquens TaxID=408 RepID=UPI00209F3396|nr:hypothetical protein [Methylorubrum extorquens]MCP1535498.1 hypothetical protein [Methylorubrum extorquens]
MYDSYSVEEGEKLLALLKEYTEKLRMLCDRFSYVKVRARLFVQITSLASLASAGFLGFYIVSLVDRNNIYGIAAYAIACFSLIPLMLTYWHNTVGKMPRYDAIVVATVLERLTKNASSQYENSKNRISDRVEYDIRLAEAEAALKMYHEVFKIKTNIDHDMVKIISKFDAGKSSI